MAMTDEEKQAIERMKRDYELAKSEDFIDIDIFTEDIRVVLNLIEKQQEELEKKDEEIRCWKSLHDEQLKIIDEMAKHIKTTAIYECPSKDCEDDGSITCEECIKEYFKKKVNSSEQN